jgi:hypothetical protein
VYEVRHENVRNEGEHPALDPLVLIQDDQKIGAPSVGEGFHHVRQAGEEGPAELDGLCAQSSEEEVRLGHIPLVSALHWGYLGSYMGRGAARDHSLLE